MTAFLRVISSWFMVHGKKNKLSTYNQSPITHHQKAFTLVELMIVVSIIAIISAVGLVGFTQTQRLGRDSKRKQDLRNIKVALEIYYQKNKRYPCSNGWVSSSGAGVWITDASYTNCGATAQENLGTSYMTKLPIDPKNSGGNPWSSATGYTYGYKGFDATLCPSMTGNFYILAAQLENQSDPDRNAVRQIKDCNGTAQTTGSWSTAFLVTSDE